MIDDGGSAWLQIKTERNYGTACIYSYGGMSLRDYIAAAVLAACYAASRH